MSEKSIDVLQANADKALDWEDTTVVVPFALAKDVVRLLLADREALVRYVRAKEAVQMALRKLIPTALLPLIKEQDAAYHALSQGLRDAISGDLEEEK